MRTRFILPLISIALCNLLSASDLSWDRTEVELLMEPEQEEIRSTFKVTNKGDEQVRISRIKTSCGCTGSIIDRKTINPGESTEIIATFNKGNRQGLNRLLLDVYIDSQEKAVASLRMNVQIPQLLQAMPQIVYWTASGTKSERRVALTLNDRYMNKIESIDYDSEKLEVIEEDDPRDMATRVLRIRPKSFDQAYRGSIIVKASGKGGRKAESRILAIVRPK